jgi:tetratricopeptide (TPR) repeat protein
MVHLREVVISIAIYLFCLVPQYVWAIQWQPLARTNRHDVAIDTGSVRLTDLSRLAVWMRFTPQGEQQRKEAAAEYGQKNYQLHLEYYEIDCSEQTATLGMVDILGPSKKRLVRMKGDSSLDAIIPGSVLDMAAQKVCPSMEEEASDSKEQTEVTDDNAPPLPEPDEKILPDESRQAISDALQATEANSTNAEAWKNLGNAYFDADLPEKAIAAYNKSLTLKPDDTDVLNDQGAMYRQIGDFTRALSNFEKARSLDPNNLESIYNSGYVHAFDLNQPDKALIVWRAYLKLDKYSETARQVQSFVDRYENALGKLP